MAAPVLPQKVAGRYEIKQILGQGGMGLVYQAYDTVVRRDIALKTLRDSPEPTALQLFYKECGVLASMSHPNIVEIFDLGEFEEFGKKKPYFVMPLLPGTTLDNLIRSASHRLTVERAVGIIMQACRGLQAAHERGLVHRDLKPSNIFVMEDDSVKIIDFGVAHMTNTHTTVGQKGTLLYMSPEQIEMKPVSALSDIFSVSVVCYEALTGRQPFRRTREEDIVEAILRQVPPPASEINASVNQAVSRVVHKGMAKQPWHRFTTAREFSETLRKAFRNEPIELFDPARIQPRLERVSRALEQKDYQFAGEILGELEAEGNIDDSITMMRQQLDKAVRQKTITQLMDAAKARYEEEEDPLSLQKLQEILQIEPDNAPALGLKSKIEKRRSERQIESWYRLAHQHVENHAYSHAREALQNVLQLRPQEARAMQLLGEVDRLEQEYNKLRQEKTQLHRAAMDAWQKGDVSSALTKLGMVLDLDRRAPDSSNPERAATYQTFYNQVRSEHDAINNAYAEARKFLAERNLGKGLAVCETFLVKYPNNALFQALKFDIEEQQRQELSAFVATIDRETESEPDLDKRYNILKDALAQHPGETHFQRALRLVEDKRDLVNSIVARAHLHEEQAQFTDALNDWEILRTIYSEYPGLKFEVERLQKRREQQARAEAKARWVEQIDSCMQSANYARVLELVGQAEPEFPGDQELTELKKTAQEGLQRSTEAQRLMTEGQELVGQNKFTEGVALLRQAHELDEHNQIVRTVLCNTLVEQAQKLLETDWQTTEDLTQQALELNPGHPLAKSLRTLVLDRKREDFVNECTSQARRLQSSADLAGAMAKVEEALSFYPQETRLIQMRDTLQRELSQAQHRQTRRRDLEELRNLDREAGNLNVSTAQSYQQRVETIAAAYPNDDEFQSVASDVQQHLNTVTRSSGVSTAPPSAVLDPASATRMFSAGAPSGAPPSTAPRPVTPSPTKAKATARAARVPRPSKGISLPKLHVPKLNVPKLNFQPLTDAFRSVAKDKKKLAIAGGALAVLVGAAVIFAVVRGRQTPAPLAALPVHIDTSPQGASIRIDNEVRGVSGLDVKLTPGVHKIQAQLDGYEPASASFDATKGSPNSLQLTLQPQLPSLRLMTDTGTGDVSLDSQPAAPLDGAQWNSAKLAPGEHSFKYVGSQEESSFNFTTQPGAAPVVEGPIAVKAGHALVISSLGSRVHVYTDSPAKLSLDGQPDMDIGADGVDLSSVSPGDHQLVLTSGDERHAVNFSVEAAPALSVFVVSHEDIGILLVEAGQDKAQVYLDGKLQKLETRGGRLRIADLKPGDYTVRVTKQGFQNAAEQHVTIRKGEEARLTFALQPVPHVASLNIQDGTPGAEVFVDNESVGTVQSDGSFQLAAVNPGDHVVELRKENFKSKKMSENFVAGSAVALRGDDAVLQGDVGQLRIAFQPSDAIVTLNKNGEAPLKIKSGSRLSLTDGAYLLTTRVGTFIRSSVVHVSASEPRSLDLQLVPGGMSDWQLPGAWRSDKKWFVRRGGGFILYRPASIAGTLVFTAMISHGHRVQWALDYKDPNNYVLFQMDENNFYRSEVRDGKAGGEVQFPFKSSKQRFRTFQVSVSPGGIVHEVFDNNTWEKIDSWSEPGTNLSEGKFGFLIPGNDEVGLSNFSYYPNLPNF